MNTMTPAPVPTHIHRPQPYLLALRWSDGFESTITLRAFRDECPCAHCKGETIMGTTYSFGLNIMKPGMYELKNLQAVGKYAIQAEWGDGHNTGIYSWDILRAIAEHHALSQDQLCELAEKAAGNASAHQG
jgi:DUF971 family protein